MLLHVRQSVSISMEKEQGRHKSTLCHTSQSAGQSAGTILSLSLHFIWILAFCYGGVYISNLSEHLNVVNKANEKLQTRVDNLEEIIRTVEAVNSAEEDRKRREIISVPKSDLTSLLRGPPGSPGKDGRDGRDGSPGRDGKDFASLDLLRGVVNETVMKEWSQLSAQLPVYGGSTYTRWGRKSCPSSATMIYRGQMTGKDMHSAGGGSNYQCIPDDPEYDINAPTACCSSLRATIYRYSSPINHRVPCSVCETKQRVTQLMIPANTRCPTTDWTLEYQGYLVSQAEHNGKGDDFFKDAHHALDYVCVDVKPEFLTGTAYPHEGPNLYLVNAACSGRGALHNCPPYKTGAALSCVVCSK